MNSSSMREKLRAEIKAQTEQFLKQGGKIQNIPIGAQKFNPLRNNQWVSENMGSSICKANTG
jgi:hypothetical protein